MKVLSVLTECRDSLIESGSLLEKGTLQPVPGTREDAHADAVDECNEAIAEVETMRKALMLIATTNQPGASSRALKQRDIAREALTALGWDFHRDQPIADLKDQLNQPKPET